MNPVINHFNVISSRSVIFIPQNFNPTFFRGVRKYWLFHVSVPEGGYDPGPLTEGYLQIPIQLNISIESYAEKSSLCWEEELTKFLNQTTVSELTLGGLHPHTNYEVSIQPCNEHGCGEISNSVFFRTYTEIPSCEPASLFLQNVSSTSMMVSWDELDTSCANGELLGYTLKCTRNQSGEYFINELITNFSNYLINLKKYELICCTVAGNNINGSGPFTPESCAHTAEDSRNLI